MDTGKVQAVGAHVAPRQRADTWSVTPVRDGLATRMLWTVPGHRLCLLVATDRAPPTPRTLHGRVRLFQAVEDLPVGCEPCSDGVDGGGAGQGLRRCMSVWIESGELLRQRDRRRPEGGIGNDPVQESSRNTI